MPDLGDSLEQRYNPLIRSLVSLEKQAICAVNGVAAGAGANIALACDIVLVADSAFAYACNNCNRNTVASAASTEFIVPTKTGDRLTAQVHERTRGSKIGVYDVEVYNQDDNLPAMFHGDSYQIRGEVTPTGETE